MINKHNLDDRRYRDIVEEAVRRIPRIDSEWTDYNPHDPGITIVELLASMVEMQSYYLNRMRNDIEKKILSISGLFDIKAKSARTDILFDVPKSLKIEYIPKGLGLKSGDVNYETTEVLYPIKGEIAVIKSVVNNYFVSRFDDNKEEKGSFCPFGENTEVGNSLIIGINAEFIDKDFEIYFDINSKPNEEALSTIDEKVYRDINYVEWEYFGDEKSWKPLNVEVDRTYNFSKSGAIKLKSKEILRPSTYEKISENEYIYIKIKVITEYENIPVLNSVYLNVVEAAQTTTYVDFTDVLLKSVISGDENNALVMNEPNMFFMGDSIKIQGFIENLGWEDIDHKFCGFDEKNQIIISESLVGKLKKYKSLRAFGCDKSSDIALEVGSSNGLPNQKYDLIVKGSILKFVLQVAREHKGKIYWKDWEEVNDFDSSNSEDTHYVLNYGTNTIGFGDGEYGYVPRNIEELKYGIRMIRCVVTKGSSGNIRAKSINRAGIQSIVNEEIKFENISAGTGGSDPINIAKHRDMIRHQTFKRNNGITLEDYERLVFNVQGFDVARARAYVDNAKSENTMTVSVLPKRGNVYTGMEFGRKTSKKFLLGICRYLDRYRLVTTRLNVIPTDVIPIDISCEVVLLPGYSLSDENIKKSLVNFLIPYDISSQNSGWEYGKTVYKSEVYQVIENLEGVDFIRLLNISSKNAVAEKTMRGDVDIPEHCLVCAGELSINVVKQGR